MSVRDRLDDARALYAAGRREGALLSVLIAVSATARKRYPKPIGDRKAFTDFVGEEMANIVLGATEGRSSVKSIELNYSGRMMTMQDLLYEIVRCNLAHEGHLPENIVFEPGTNLSIKVETDKVTLSDSWLKGLTHVIVQSPENSEEFADCFEHRST